MFRLLTLIVSALGHSRMISGKVRISSSQYFLSSGVAEIKVFLSKFAASSRTPLAAS